MIAQRGELRDLVLGSGQQRADFARRKDRRNAILDRALDLELARRRLADHASLFEISEEDFQCGDFSTNGSIAIWAGPELLEVILELLGRDVDHVRVVDVNVELTEIGLVSADRA